MGTTNHLWSHVAGSDVTGTSASGPQNHRIQTQLHEKSCKLETNPDKDLGRET